MVESSFEFTVSSKNKPILLASGHEFYLFRKQLDVNMPPIPVARNFEIPEIFENFIRTDSGSNDHEQIVLCGDPEMLSSGEVIFLVSRWNLL